MINALQFSYQFYLKVEMVVNKNMNAKKFILNVKRLA